MSLSSKLTAKIQKAAKRLGPFDTRKLYKRVLTETGGDTLIDRGVTQTATDTVLKLQPLVTRVGKRAAILSTASVLVNPFDYEFTFTPDQMAYADVQNKNITLVFKDSLGNEEALELVLANPMILGGVEASVHAVYRSVSR